MAAEYLAWGEASGGRGGRPWGRGHVRMRRAHLAWWENRLGLQTLGDVAGALPKVETALREKQAAGASGKTLQNTSQCLGAFCRWAMNRGYLESDPLRHLGRFNTELRSRRRAMTGDEIRRLLEAAPPDRRLLYALAFTSGLRAGELRGLKVRDVSPDRPSINVRTEIAKSRKAAMQPIPVGLWKALKAGAEGKDPDAALLYVPSHPARELDKNLERVGILKWGPAGKLDFHAARVTYITMLLESGADVKTCMTLARHSTPDLTINTYGRARQERLDGTAEAVEEMILAGPKNITGTERKAVGAEYLVNPACYDRECEGSIPSPGTIFSLPPILVFLPPRMFTPKGSGRDRRSLGGLRSRPEPVRLRERPDAGRGGNHLLI